MQVLFRHAEERDIPEIMRIGIDGLRVHYRNFPKEAVDRIAEEQYSIDEIKKSMQKDLEEKGFFIVGETGGKIIGVCNVIAKGKICEVKGLHVDNNFAGRGLGSNFLGKGEIFAKMKGCRKYVAYANKSNRDLIHFFLKNGFRHFDEKDKERELKDGKILWHMEKYIA